MKTNCYSDPTSHIHFYLPFIAMLVLIFGTSVNAIGQWKQHIIEGGAYRISDGDGYDIDRDGDMDLFATFEYADKIVFYENINNIQWERHIVDDGAGAPAELEVVDLNQDGNMDLLIAFMKANLIAWYEYENAGEDSLQWTKHEIENRFVGGAYAQASDINGDGAIDVVSGHFYSGELAWHENNLPEAWTTHIIQTDMRGYISIDLGDVNNDNRPDVVCSFEKGNRVVLFMNNLPDSSWSEITVDGDMPKTRWSEIGDIDNDGDLDIASGAQGSELNEVDVAWYENDGTGENWIKHTIANQFADGIYIELINMDNNEYPDVVLSDKGTSCLYVLLNDDGGQHWTPVTIREKSEGFKYGHRSLDIDMDGDFDVIRGVWDGGDLCWYENPHPSAFASSFTVSPFLIQSRGDTLWISTTMRNPYDHPVKAWAVINGDQTGFTDTLQLFDDGQHGDGSPRDHQWGNTRLKSDFPEDEFLVDLFTYDSTYGDTLGFFTDASFSTLGPVALFGYESTNDTVPEPGDLLRVKIELVNNGQSATATEITAGLNPLDSLATIPNYKRGFEDMAPGATSISSNIYVVKISEDCPRDRELPIEVTIFSHGQACWRDTFSINVITGFGIDEANEKEVRIFPNPVNNFVTIETRQPGRHMVSILSINGQVLHSSDLKGTTHQIDLTSFKKGVYFITISSKDFVTTRKIIRL